MLPQTHFSTCFFFLRECLLIAVHSSPVWLMSSAFPKHCKENLQEIIEGLAAHASTQGRMQESHVPATEGFEGSRITPSPCLLPSLFPSQCLQQAQHLLSTAEQDRPQGKFKNILKGHLLPFSHCLN